jgi:hypothetical protein
MTPIVNCEGVAGLLNKLTRKLNNTYAEGIEAQSGWLGRQLGLKRLRVKGQIGRKRQGYNNGFNHQY